MDFGSSVILSKPVDPTVDYETIDDKKYSSAIRVAMARNRQARGNDTCMLDIIDTAGQDEYSSMREEYMRTSQAFIIVFSVTSSASLEEAISIYDFCCRLKKVTSVPAVLCGNMSDLKPEKRQVTDDKALSLAKGRKMWYFSTSAKTGDNVQEAFFKLIRMTPRTGIEYKIAVLGGGGVGKSAITFRFLRDEFIEDYDPTVEDTFRKQISVPGLPSIESSKPASEEEDDFQLVDTPGTPLLGAKDVRKVAKKDANVVFVNLGSLAPENFDNLDIKTLSSPPPACSSCSAVFSTSSTCDFCGVDHPKLASNLLQPREKIEEYTLVPGQEPKTSASAKTPTVPKKSSNVNSDSGDKKLVVFCIDISGSMGSRTAPNEMQSMWQSMRQKGTTSSSQTRNLPPMSRLDHIKDAVQAHLERLKENYPDCKVALISFHSKLECFLGKTKSFFLSSSNNATFNLPSVASLGEGMAAAKPLTTGSWHPIAKAFDSLSKHTAELGVKGATALGSALAVALGLAKFHHEQVHGASTEIFVCTDGAANTGVGSVGIGYNDGDLSHSMEHGRPFYSLAGEMAVANSAKINIIGIDGEGMALDILSVAAQISGGVVNKVDAAELTREIRATSQRRVLAKNVTVKLHLPKEWKFIPNQRKDVIISANTLSYVQAQVDDEASVSFPFTVTDAGKTQALAGTLPIQAQITYTTANTGAVKVRLLRQMMPLTADRDLSEAGINVAFMGTYILQHMGFATNELLVRTIGKASSEMTAEARDLRDTLYAYRKLLIRGARNNTQQEELSKFEESAEKLDKELERLMAPAEQGKASRRDAQSALVTQYQQYNRNSLVGSSNSVAWGSKVKRAQMMR